MVLGLTREERVDSMEKLIDLVPFEPAG